MMNTTHTAMGLTLAAPLVLVAPELAPVAALAGLAGGVFPDLDLLSGQHRRTLHFPVYYGVAGVAASGAALLAPTEWTVAAAFFLLSAALHCVTDAAGGGLELRPWEATDDRGVYVHPAGRWIRPRRWVRYDGAPEDLLLTAVFSIPGLLLFDGLVRALTVVGLAASVVYVAVRKRLPEVETRYLR
ncbi:metal-dependent hydrolase [Halorussus gelatinilyticus]|uniref:Metal-dependent hydrolase n=1 Tax=Halorussus gelatinilyticus TaxID=2937524 RepID=A0A8U0ILL0_9EURY|nr:metal-dependent hydrolase [Halorussus gelatinilyticus]UPW01232.1 metal-dependent hydrolase [Halorussus gelatinilyticus]